MARILLAMFACLALLLGVACGDDDDDGAPFGNNGPNSGQSSGDDDGGDSQDDGDDAGSDDGDDSGDDGDEGGDSASSAGGQCDYRVTGDVELSGTGPGGSNAFGSDYYYSDDQMEEILRAFAEISASDEDEVDQLVAEGMAADPRLYILILNCIDDDDFSLSILPSGEAKYADIPFGAGTYVIPEGGPLGGDTGPDEFTIFLGLDDDSVWGVSEAGELVIRRWDEKGIAGTFRFVAEEAFATGEPKTITVEGSFNFDCSDGDRCES